MDPLEGLAKVSVLVFVVLGDLDAGERAAGRIGSGPRPRLPDVEGVAPAAQPAVFVGHVHGEGELLFGVAASQNGPLQTFERGAGPSEPTVPRRQAELATRVAQRLLGGFAQTPAEQREQRGGAGDVLCVVGDDGLHEVAADALDVIEVDAGDERAGNVAGSFDAEDLVFNERQSAGRQSAAPKPPGRVQQVQMGHLKRRGNAAKHEAGLEEGDIERLAVEGDQALEIPNAPDKGFQHGRFLGKVLHEKLLDHKTLSPEEAESH